MSYHEPSSENIVVEINWQGFDIKVVEYRGDSYLATPRLLIAYSEYDSETERTVERSISLPGYCLDKLIDLLPRVRSLYRSNA